MALKPKRLLAGETGLPWDTGVADTTSCGRCSSKNTRPMFRKCKHCIYRMCPGCFDKEGVKHSNCQGGQQAVGPFPTHAQERAVLGVHDATNPDRTLSRAEAAEHNGAWTWTPPPAVAARHPDIALPGSSIQYATSAPSPAPIVGGTAMPATSFGTQVPAPTTESAAVQHDNECEPKRYGKRPADALENDEVSAADEDDASADLTIAQSRPKRHRGGHELKGVQETRTLELDATGKLKLTLMPGIQAVRVPIADAATTTSPASAAAGEQIQLFYQWYNTDNATVRRELVAVIDNPEEGGSEVAVRSQIVQNGASDSIGRGISTLAHGRFVRAITSDEVEVEVEEDGDALPTMEE